MLGRQALNFGIVKEIGIKPKPHLLITKKIGRGRALPSKSQWKFVPLRRLPCALRPGVRPLGQIGSPREVGCCGDLARERAYGWMSRVARVKIDGRPERSTRQQKPPRPLLAPAGRCT